MARAGKGDQQDGSRPQPGLGARPYGSCRIIIACASLGPPVAQQFVGLLAENMAVVWTRETQRDAVMGSLPHVIACATPRNVLLRAMLREMRERPQAEHYRLVVGMACDAVAVLLVDSAHGLCPFPRGLTHHTVAARGPEAGLEPAQSTRLSAIPMLASRAGDKHQWHHIRTIP